MYQARQPGSYKE